jgi:MFS superfamily sulfate permease-like transporter
MALSLSSNLAHAPPINGLYSFVINPFIYAVLGSSPLLVVGPEAAGSLLTGTIVKTSVRQGHSHEDNAAENAMVVGVATAMAGSMILIAGLTRLGFLDNVLSRPFLRGFITAIGFVIFVDQLIPEAGLADMAKDAGVSHGSTVEKLLFFFRNVRNCHRLTAAMSFSSFAIIMVFRYVLDSSGVAYVLTWCAIQNCEKKAGTALSPGRLLSRSYLGSHPCGNFDVASRLG